MIRNRVVVWLAGLADCRLQAPKPAKRHTAGNGAGVRHSSGSGRRSFCCFMWYEHSTDIVLPFPYQVSYCRNLM